jgi:pyruvate dehydrogenase E1 component beta subunit
MPKIAYREAIRQAIDEEMGRDENVILLGEEVAEYEGAYKCTRGLLETYGDKRVFDTPITEEGFTGIGIGAAIAGKRVIVEWMTFNFSLQAFDQTVNNAAKYRHMSGGQIKVPMVFRGPNGPAAYLSSQHSQAVAALYTHIPGLKVCHPATPYDAKGMLKTAIRDDNPVVFMEGELMYGWEGEVPEKEYTVPLGKADVKREGGDVTLVTFGKPLRVTMEAAETLAEDEGVEAEVVDLRSLRPLDMETVAASVEKTNRCVVVDESWPMCSVGSHVAWEVHRRCFDLLDAEVGLVSSDDVPMPYNHRLELAVQPSTEKVVSAAKTALYLE